MDVFYFTLGFLQVYKRGNAPDQHIN